MKINFLSKSIFFSLFVLVGIRTYSQDYFWSANQKIPLQRDPNLILIHAEVKSEIEQALTRLGSISSIERVNDKSLLARLKSIEQRGPELVSSITSNMTHSFLSDSGQNIIPTGEILFKPKKGVSFEDINILANGQLTVVKVKYESYRVFINDYSKLLDIANAIYESGLVEYCHPVLAP